MQKVEKYNQIPKYCRRRIAGSLKIQGFHKGVVREVMKKYKDEGFVVMVAKYREAHRKRLIKYCDFIGWKSEDIEGVVKIFDVNYTDVYYWPGTVRRDIV